MQRCSLLFLMGMGAINWLIAPRLLANADHDDQYTGRTVVEFDPAALDLLNWHVSARLASQLEREGPVQFPTKPIDADILLALKRGDELGGMLLVESFGALAIAGPLGDMVLGNLTVVVNAHGDLEVHDGFLGLDGPPAAFELRESTVHGSVASRTLTVSGELVVTESLAASMGDPLASGTRVGWLHAEVQAASVQGAGPIYGTDRREVESDEAAITAAADGPDVIVGAIYQTFRWGDSQGKTAYSIGTTSCNIGNQPAQWIAATNRHPVIAQNLYRLKNGRFEQIGMSWVKHGFFALSERLCSGPGGCQGDLDGDHLGPGCSDPYSAELNGGQFPLSPTRLGPRHEVNPVTGFFPFPFTPPQCIGLLCRRIQVNNDDLEPTLNFGANYYAEAHYIVPDDAAAGNQNNNASYRRVSVSEQAEGVYTLVFPGGPQTLRERPGIQAWRDADPLVRLVNLDVPGDGRFIVGYKVTGLGQGRWHYEYAVQNFNSDRAAKSFVVPLPEETELFDVGFRDVDEHSGSPISGADWTTADEMEFNQRRFSWNTEPFETNVNANALRWSRLYNFRFDADAPPWTSEVQLALFKPGVPESMSAMILVPGGPVEVIGSDPPHGTVEARQPSQLDGSLPVGITSFRISLNVNLIGVTIADFELVQDGGTAPPPELGQFMAVTDNTFTMTLQSPTVPGAWTRINYRWNGAGVEVGYLPGDVDGNATNNSDDALALIAALDGQPDARPLASTDMDRSTALTPLDLLRWVDLFNGADAFEAYGNTSLPPRE